MTTPEGLKNPRHAAPPSEDIILDAIFNGSPVIFRASANDTVQYGREIHKAALSGEYGNIADYVPPAQQKDQPIKMVPGTGTDLMKRIEALEKDVAALKAKQ
jgi:hypothetical protein